MRFLSFLTVIRPRPVVITGWLAGLIAVGMLAGCGGGGGSSSSSNSATSAAATSTIAAADTNVSTITVQQGPNANLANAPFVTVTVCAPGSSTCDTINNVIVDTGSVGLRVLASAVPNSLSTLTRIQLSSSSQYLAVCGQFLSGYTWGTGRLADIKMSGQSASSVPIQVIADSAVGSAPSQCSNGSATSYSTAATLGANGILGVEGLIQDCGATCVSTATSAWYWGCSSTTACSSPSQTTVPLAQQITNPVSKFATDNNGVIIELPVIASTGAATATGALVFGIGTRTNNALGSATVVQTDSAFNFKSTYNGTTNTGAFVDTGSNFLYLDDSSIATCTSGSYSGFFCPSSTVSRSVTFSSNVSGATSTYSTTFNIANAQTLFSGNNYYAYNDIGVQQTNQMDFGLPFFYGKNVFVKMETAANLRDGYLAFISNVN
ncbi:DUF3443 family protein [Robbsia andropogonis]|uniref:DUF3443 family protein n=1 Tax=Robbsia andropogonis TaxID=28092 RepID=UPI0009DE9384|nr:DUF3443 family protein [Robbsia andropogonis]